MTELHLETMKRHELIAYLVAHIYPRAGAGYKSSAARALAGQSTETLLAMAKSTRAAELEREEKQRAARAARRKDEHQHTTTSGAR